MESLSELLKLGSEPISESTPAGEDPRSSPEYEAMLAQVALLGSVHGAGTVNWQAMAESAAAVLKKQAKDIPAAAYLGIALTETHGLPGLAAGSRILADMLCLWWEGGFPPLKRLRARANMLQWWRDRAKIFLERAHDPVPASVAGELEEALKALDEAIGERLPDVPPLGELRNAVRRLDVLPEAVPTEAQQAADEPARPNQSPDQSPGQSPNQPPNQPPAQGAVRAEAAPAPASAPPVQPPAAPESLEAGLLQVFALCGSVFECVPELPPSDMQTWRIFYLSLWGKLRRTPPAEDGRTALPPPDSSGLASCVNMLRAGNSRGAAAALLRFLPSCPFCLDAQRLLDESLIGSGEGGGSFILRQEVQAFLQRLPGVELLAFSDGTAFADSETRAWLGSLANAEQPRSACPLQGGDSAEQTLHDEALARADELDAKKQTAQALEVLQQAGSALHRNGPLALSLEIRQMELLMKRKRWDLATVLAASVIETLDRHQLDLWQPELSFIALSTVQAVWRGTGGAQGEEEARRLLPRLARLNLSALYG
ncbi:MAG: type VI secretion system protein TssA [Desulfovibrionaceae bacterium]|nr:type VI secretion system protein TssA [Desulfovibrionaceae bacterium]